MNEIVFRPIERNDLDEVFSLLQQMTEIDLTDRDKDLCWELFSKGSSESTVGVYQNQIIAYGSIVLEYKIRGGISGHLEYIVVDSKFRHRKVGIELIKRLVEIGEQKGCYRLTLFCKESLTNFYSKNGFEVNNVVMKKFLK